MTSPPAATDPGHEDDLVASIRALRGACTTKRGLGDDFLRLVASDYLALVASGVTHPVKAFAERHSVDIATASRWISRARSKAFLPA